MLVVLDTNSLIRFFTNDIPDKASKVKIVLEKERNLYIPEVVFPELEYILTDQYGISREKLITIFQFLSSRKNIKLTQHLKKAITIFEKTRLDMADCVIAAYALKGSLASFDIELLAVQGMHSLWKK